MSRFPPRWPRGPAHAAGRAARLFAIAGGTAQVQRTLIAEDLLGRKLPQRP